LAIALGFAANGLVAGRVGASFGALPGLLAFFIKVLVDGFPVALGFAADCLVTDPLGAGFVAPLGLVAFFIRNFLLVVLDWCEFGNFGLAALRENCVDGLGQQGLHGGAFFGGYDFQGGLNLGREVRADQHASGAGW